MQQSGDKDQDKDQEASGMIQVQVEQAREIHNRFMILKEGRDSIAGVVRHRVKIRVWVVGAKNH